MSRHLTTAARFLGGILLALSALVVAAGSAQAGRLGDDLQQQLATVAGDTPLKVTIRFADRVDLAPFAHRNDRHAARREMIKSLHDRATKAQGPLQRQLRGQGHKATELWLINALATELPAAEIAALAAWPGVESVELTGTTPPPAPLPLATATPAAVWNLDAVGATNLNSAPLGLTGTGVVVAVLDTGVDGTHQEVASKYRGLAGDWYDPYKNTLTPYDSPNLTLTHGTAVTSVIVGDNTGVAPGAQWIAAKIFPDTGGATNDKIHAAFQWAFAPGGNPDNAPDIVNASWGFETLVNLCDATFQSDIATLQAAGISVVFAAGNKGPNPATSISPANLFNGFAVGAATEVTAANATTPGTQVSYFSSRGPTPCPNTPNPSPYLTPTSTDVFPELLAPGYNIYVANSAYTFPNNYSLVAGTSFAAPHVSGALALLRQAQPGATRLELELALLDSASDIDLPNPDQNAGYGLLDVAAAYYRLSNLPSLAVYTPGAPENDDLVEFGNVPLTTGKDLDLRLTNVGGGDLTLLSVNPTLTTDFSIGPDTCSTTTTLAPDTSCSITLHFAPTAPGPAATASLAITSDDPRTPSRTIRIAGAGNTSPPAAIPITPAAASNQTLPLTFTWFQDDDVDGDPLTTTLYLADDVEFTNVLRTVIGTAIPPATLALLLLPLPMLLNRRCRFWVILALAALLLSCGGGGGSSAPPPVANYTATVDSLPPAPTYYWKVVTSDGQGNPVESSVRSFTTIP